ncbi:MAG: cyclic nucleotide-binding domain-containing protein [Deltaproteobacteria bacterium]|nr:cyclic nucleotide-binding domain-containing protein [Deltaproteobacteria bacterium]
MQISCPQCHTPYTSKFKGQNKLHCKQCKAEFLAPIEAMNQIRLEKIAKERQQLEHALGAEKKGLEQKYMEAKKQLEEEAQKIAAESKRIEASAESKTVNAPIAKKLLKIVLSIYFIVVLSVTLGLMTFQFYETKAQINLDLKSSEKIFLKGLGDALWNIDSGALRAIISGMLKHPVIIGVMIRDDSGEEMGAGGILLDEKGKYVSFGDKVSVEKESDPVEINPKQKGVAGIFGHTFPILYASKEGEKSTVGKATVYSTTAFVIDRIKVGYGLLLVNAIVVAIALVFTLLWASRRYLGWPLSILTHAVTQLNLNNLDSLEVDVQTSERNELKILEQSYNRMVSNLIDEKKRIVQMSQTFEKFVPKQFMSRIAEQGIGTIKLGRIASDHLTIMYSRIQSFDTLSEQMNSEVFFQYLNAYLARMEAPIEKHGGFIYQLQTNGIMALFDLNDRSMEALSSVYAAIDMQNAVKDFNEIQQPEGHPPIAIQIGIHSGDVIFGTLGNETRLDPTLVGEAIDIATRLQEVAQDYNSQTVISEDTFNLIASEDAFQWRELDLMPIKGHEDPLRIFEVFDAETVMELKQQIAKPFRDGLTAFRAQKWDEATAFFEQCLKVYPVDRVAQMHLQRCQNRKADQTGVAGFLKNETEVFKALDDTAVTEIAQSFQEMHFKKGQPVIKAGDVGSRFYVIYKGVLEVILNDGVQIATLKSGDCFGEMSLMTGEPIRATIKGVEGGTLLTIKREEFQNLLRAQPRLNSYFYKLFLQRVEQNKDTQNGAAPTP